MNKKLLRLICFGLAAAAIVMRAQAPAPKLEFEVASIKPAPPITPDLMRSGKMHMGVHIDGARVDIGGMPIAALLPQVFRVKQYQVSGAGTTMDFTAPRWDIQAKLPDGATQDQVPDMLLSLLVDRFKLAYHRENKERPVYALVVGKSGTKLQEASTEPDAPLPDDPKALVLHTGGAEVRINRESGAGGGRGAVISSPQLGTVRMRMGEDGNMHLEAPKVTMAVFAEMLNRFVDRPVLDMTEVKGSYQITLDLPVQDFMTMARAQGNFGGGFGGPPARREPTGTCRRHRIRRVAQSSRQCRSLDSSWKSAPPPSIPS